MLTRQHLRTRTRCTLVVLAATVLAAGLVRLLLHDVAAPVPTVAEGLVRICAISLAGSVGWAWLATLSGVSEAWRGRPVRVRAARPLRRLVLLLCGVALAAPVGSAAADEEPGPRPGIAGLPLPDRATGPARWPSQQESRPAADAAARSVVVRTGDCLWRLAAADLPRDASPARVAARWRAIYVLNTAVIGPDPDLIHPGQRLVLPPG